MAMAGVRVFALSAIMAVSLVANAVFYTTLLRSRCRPNIDAQAQMPSASAGPPGGSVSDAGDLLRSLCAGDPPPRSVAGNNAHCALQVVVPDPDEEIDGCEPFEGGDGVRLFGLKWCAWEARRDKHISAAVLQSMVPYMEKVPMEAFRAAFENKPRGIVIDAGAQVGMFSAAALASGHYTISIDARPEHVQMNMVSRRLNNVTGDDNGLIVHGALAERCGQYATIPVAVGAGNNPGGTTVVGGISNGYPRLRSRDDFYRFHKVPLLTLDHIMDHALRNLPPSVERKVYALKVDIEGYEARALMGAARLFSEMRPDTVVMELFADRMANCSAKYVIESMARLKYSVSVSPRKNVDCGGGCERMIYGSDQLNVFLRRMREDAEMDLIFRQIDLARTKS